MQISKEEFDSKFRESLDALVEDMAESSEVNVKSFYNMTCFLENLAFFSPVIYDLIRKTEE